MIWKAIRLELSENRQFPAGSVSRGYLIRVPLDDQGFIDPAALEQSPYRATVRRFWSTEPDESGHVVRSNGHWALRCAGKPDRLLCPATRLGPGEDVAVTEGDGAALPFRVASIRRLG